MKDYSHTAKLSFPYKTSGLWESWEHILDHAVSQLCMGSVCPNYANVVLEHHSDPALNLLAQLLLGKVWLIGSLIGHPQERQFDEG